MRKALLTPAILPGAGRDDLEKDAAAERKASERVAVPSNGRIFMRMTLKSVAVAVALMTAGLTGTAVPALARDGVVSSNVILVHDNGRRHYHERGRYERRDGRRHYDRRDRYESRRHVRPSRYERDHRRDRRDRRGDQVIIRLN